MLWHVIIYRPVMQTKHTPFTPLQTDTQTHTHPCKFTHTHTLVEEKIHGHLHLSFCYLSNALSSSTAQKPTEGGERQQLKPHTETNLCPSSSSPPRYLVSSPPLSHPHISSDISWLVYTACLPPTWHSPSLLPWSPSFLTHAAARVWSWLTTTGCLPCQQCCTKLHPWTHPQPISTAGLPGPPTLCEMWCRVAYKFEAGFVSTDGTEGKNWV